MSEDQSYYNILGVSKDASEKEIKRAYRKKAMKLHPDRYDGPKEEAEEKFKKLNEAYDILSDPEQRKVYDRFGKAGLEGAGSRARSADPLDFFSQIFNFDIGDIFGGGGGFGGRQRRGRRRQSGPQKGEDVILDLELSFEEVYEGVSKKVKMPFNSPCKHCEGRRAEPGSGFKTCPNCKGAGVVEQQTRQGMFVQINRAPCDNCKGSGQVPEKPCSKCNGSGRSNTREEIKIKIPRGIDDGEAVRVKEKGRPSPNGGKPGDLIFRINLKEHDTFERNGADTYMKLPVDYPTMVLGGKMEVPMISGKKEQRTGTLKIPKGTEINDVLKLRNEGFKKKVRGNQVTGDAYYVITLKIPKKVSKEERKLLKQLKEVKH